MDEKRVRELERKIVKLRKARDEAELQLGRMNVQRQALSVIEAMLDIYYQTDMQGKLLYISPSCLSQTGYRPEELIGRSVTDFYADAGQRNGLLAELQKSGMVNDFTARLVHKDGQPRYASVTSRMMHDEQGRPTGVEGILRNITERMLAEERLKESEARLGALFQSCPDYALLLEMQASGPPLIVDANDAFFEKFGYTRKEMVGQPITRFETPASVAQVDDRRAMLADGEAAHFEVEHRCRDGSTFFARVSSRIVPGTVGPNIMVVEQDITSIKLAEFEQKRLLEENRRLMRNIMRLQEEERRRLARDLHDDLGQLLTSIDTNASYIFRYADDREVHDAAGQIIRDAQSAFDATHDVLLKLRPTTLDALGVKAALQELADHWSSKHGVVCHLDVDGDIDRMDDMRAIAVYRVIQEGVTNARRHGRASRINVRTRIMPNDRGHEALLVEIEDNGKGGHIETLSSGLGIIGMRERVHAMGGTFMLTNLPKGGVRIEAIVPLQDGAQTS